MTSPALVAWRATGRTSCPTARYAARVTP
jgi:hypothetical protein